MNRISKFLKVITNSNLSRVLLNFQFNGYLKSIGWIESYLSGKPQSNGEAIPWVTYSFIDFISSRLTKDLTLFEYGSGASTEFYAKKVKQIFSVEHDLSWYQKIEKLLPDNAKLYYISLDNKDEYCGSSLKNNPFDIIIVDGRERNKCIINAVHALSDNGVIILDDSEREEYYESFLFLKKYGFKNIEFTGIAPGVFYKKSTTIFYKNNNCLGI